MNNKENIDPQKTRTIIKVVIAILSAILGALGGAATVACSHMLQ